MSPQSEQRFIIRCLLALALISLALTWPGEVRAERRFSVGAGLGLLELHGLEDTWGMAVDTVQLVQGVAEFSPLAGLGVRFTGAFSLPGGPQLFLFETALLFHFPGRNSRLYLGGGSGILSQNAGPLFTLHLAAGLKRDLMDSLTVFLDVRLLQVLDLSGGRLFLPGLLRQFTPGVTFYF